jgi:hypothetical protein
MSHGRWPGTWRVICDICGMEYPSDEVHKRWDGFIVCPSDWESKHPQLSIRIPKEHIGVPFARPEPEDAFAFSCDLWSSSPMADFGEADCATVGGNTNIDLLISLFNPSAIAGIAIAGRSIPGVF